MKFVNHFLKAVRRDVLAMRPDEVQLNAPFAQWHLQSRIPTAGTRHMG